MTGLKLSLSIACLLHFVSFIVLLWYPVTCQHVLKVIVPGSWNGRKPENVSLKFPWKANKQLLHKHDDISKRKRDGGVFTLYQVTPLL